ncbi:MAG TPA: molybdate ABC transporter substrate-binding protein [Chitinivibrionales bacterium]|nr:molybdate ABC transporter substrate-binding protein [Chitinivibrionales bacterium]
MAAFLFCQNIYSQITVACASNMQPAMEEIKIAYEKTGGRIKSVFGSSGKFTSQIKNGAPFDVFVSADMDYPESLYVWKYAGSRPKVYAYGKLVLWSLKTGLAEKGVAGLGDAGISKIAIADPRLAPYGRESERAMKNGGVYDAVSSRIVYGDNIAQAAQYIVTGAADIGFTAKSIVLSPQNKDKGTWADVDSTLYSVIAQGVMVCRYGADNNPDASEKFVSFLLGPGARDIMKQFGYSLP